MLAISVVGDVFIDIIVPIYDIIPNGAQQRDIKVSFGGTANIAVWISRLGGKTRFFGKVGNDPLGISFKNNLKEENVEDFTVMSNNYPTGICVSLVGKDGERTMITNRGANDHLTIEDAKKFMTKMLNSKLVFFSGYSFISSKTSKAVEFLMKNASDNDCEIWFNPGAMNIINDKIKTIIKNYVDVLVLNEDEGKTLFGVSNDEKILQKMRELVYSGILTKGADGCLILEGDKRFYTPAKKVSKVVDTTGAGDAFIAGTIKGIIDGKSLEESTYIGHEVASKVIRRFGAR